MTHGPAPGIHLTNVSLRYGGDVLFDRLDLRMAGGRTTCLLGPSGVGKSSLLRLIAGLEAPGASGRVAADDGAPLHGRIAHMAQTDALMPWLSVLDNVTLGARLRRQRPDRDRARALLAQVGLADAADLRPAALSGGMRQRAALARTLMEDRPVVLMDEPFSALDAITRLRLQDLAARLLARRTVILVTHDPLEALRLGHELRLLAGRPARLDPAPVPPGAPPRDTDDAVLAEQAQLLHRLRQGAEAVP